MTRTPLFRWTCLLTLLAAVASCNWGDQAGSRVALTLEQIRLEHINTIDSTTLSTILNPDSVEGSDTLASLSADAWMLIDDATGMVISQKYANEPRFMASLRSRR